MGRLTASSGEMKMADPIKSAGDQIAKKVADMGQAVIAFAAFVATLMNPEWRAAITAFVEYIATGVRLTATWFTRFWWYNVPVLIRGAARITRWVIVVAPLLAVLLIFGAIRTHAVSSDAIFALLPLAVVLLPLFKLHRIISRLAPLNAVGLTEPLGPDLADLRADPLLTEVRRQELIGLRWDAFRQAFRARHGTLPRDHSPASDGVQVAVMAAWTSAFLVVASILTYVFCRSDQAAYAFTGSIAVLAILVGLYGLGLYVIIEAFVADFGLKAANAAAKVGFGVGKAGAVFAVPNIDDENADEVLGLYGDPIANAGLTLKAVRREVLVGPALMGVVLLVWQHPYWLLAWTILLVGALLADMARHGKNINTIEAEQRNVGLAAMVLTLCLMGRAMMLIDAASGCHLSATLNGLLDILNAFLGFRFSMLTSENAWKMLGAWAMFLLLVALAWNYKGIPLSNGHHIVTRFGVGAVVVVVVTLLVGQALNMVGQGLHIPTIASVCSRPPSGLFVLTEQRPERPEQHTETVSQPAPVVMPTPQIVQTIVQRHSHRAVIMVARTTPRLASDPCLDASNPGYQAMMRRQQRCDPATGRYIGPR